MSLYGTSRITSLVQLFLVLSVHVIVVGEIGCQRNSTKLISDPTAIEATGQPTFSKSDWPCWRGPEQNNRAEDLEFPDPWSDEESIVWKTNIPGSGHSSPCVYQENIYLTSADEDEEIQNVIAVNASDGSLRWQTPIHRGQFPNRHVKNSHASSTPLCDGSHILCCFVNSDSLYVTAVDFDGVVSWRTRVGSYKTTHGFGASPTMYRSLIIVACEDQKKPVLAGIDRRSGNVMWRVSHNNKMSYGSPVVAHVSGRNQLVLPTWGGVVSHDPTTGEFLWSCHWEDGIAVNSVCWDDQRIYASASGKGGPRLVCVRADGRGDVTESHVVWRKDRGAIHVPCPIVVNGRLYLLGDKGVVRCLDALTGELIWRQRLGGNFFASPILAGDNFYAASEQGMIHVWREGLDFEHLAKKNMQQNIMASPVICNGRLYLRTTTTLYCIAGSPSRES